MSIEQHAEAAANDIGETPTSTLGTVEHIIAKHMQSAIDEATAPLRARIAELKGLGPLIEEYAEMRAMLGTDDGAAVDKPDLWQQMIDKHVSINAILEGGDS